MKHATTGDFARSLLVIATMLAVSACGDDATGPNPNASGSYALTKVTAVGTLIGGGNGLPVTFTDGGGNKLVVHDGNITLDGDGGYEVSINVSFNNGSYDVFDNGTYKMNGKSIAFTSVYGAEDNFIGTLNGATLKATYNIAGLDFKLDLVR